MNAATRRCAGWRLVPAAVLGMLLVTGAVAQPGLAGRPRVQVRFVTPVGMRVWFQAPTGQFEKVARITVPGRINLRAGCGYRLKLTDIPNRPGVTLYPTLEIGQFGQNTAVLMAHLAVPIEFSDEDFDRVAEGQVITKVVFLSARGDSTQEGIAMATSYQASGDAIQEARRSGTVLAIIRLGNIDLEAPAPPR